MKTTTAIRNSIATVLLDAINNGTTNPPALEFYTGTVPASMGLSITDTLLAELELSVPAGTVTGGVLTFDPITDDSSANATGDAGWARVIDRDGAEVAYFTVTATGGGGDITLNTVSVASGGPVAMTSLQVTIGGA